MKKRLKVWIPILVLVTFFLGTRFADAHFFWIETDNKATIQGKQEIRIFLGHPDMPDTNILPELVNTLVRMPDGSTASLSPEKEGDHWKASVALDQNGDYIITSTRKPGFFDPKWHDHDAPARIMKDCAKIIIHNRFAEGNWSKAVNQELEIVPLIKPYNLHIGDTFKARVLYNGKSVRGDYSAALATQNIHDVQQIQRGTAQKDGLFSIKIDKAGMWVVMVEYGVEESGAWIATHDLIYKNKTYYSKGDKLLYSTVKNRNTMTFWVDNAMQ